MSDSKLRTSDSIPFSVLTLMVLSMTGCGSSQPIQSTKENSAAAAATPTVVDQAVEPQLTYPVPDGSAEELAAFLGEMAQRIPTGVSPEEETEDLADIMTTRVHAANKILSILDAESIYREVACEAKLESLRVLALVGHGNEADFVSFADELIGSDHPDLAQLGRIGHLQQQLDEARTLGMTDTGALLSSVNDITVRARDSARPDVHVLYAISEASEVLLQIDEPDAAVRVLLRGAELLKDPPATESVLSVSTRIARELETVGQFDAARTIHEMIRDTFSGHENEHLREMADETLRLANKRHEQRMSNDEYPAPQKVTEEESKDATDNKTELDTDEPADVSDEPAAEEAKPEEPGPTLESAAAFAREDEADTNGKIIGLPAVAERNPYAPDADMSIAELVEFILEMQDKSRSIQRRDGFVAGVIEAADRVLTADTNDRFQVLAALAKFKYLHRDAVLGNAGADEALQKMTRDFAADTRPEIAAEVAFLAAEQNVLAASGKPAGEATRYIDAAISFIAESPEDLGPKHLRMASATVGLINSLEDSQQREGYFQQLADHLVKSSEKQVSQYGKRIAGTRGDDGPAELVGKPLQLDGDTVEGDPFDWQAYRGRVVLVDFWATWCGPCRAMMPKIEELYHTQHDRGFDVVGISLDEDLEQLADFLAENDIPWTLLAGEGTAKLADQYGIRGIPLLMLVDTDGKIVATDHQLEAMLMPIQNLLDELDDK